MMMHFCFVWKAFICPYFLKKNFTGYRTLRIVLLCFLSFQIFHSSCLHALWWKGCCYLYTYSSINTLLPSPSSRSWILEILCICLWLLYLSLALADIPMCRCFGICPAKCSMRFWHLCFHDSQFVKLLTIIASTFYPISFFLLLVSQLQLCYTFRNYLTVRKSVFSFLLNTFFPYI